MCFEHFQTNNTDALLVQRHLHEIGVLRAETLIEKTARSWNEILVQDVLVRLARVASRKSLPTVRRQDTSVPYMGRDVYLHTDA